MEKITRLPGSWQMDEGETNSDHPRYIGKRNENKDHVNFKCPETLVRFVDEYIASRVDPFCRTRSDVFNDAILAWVLTHKDSSPKLQVMAFGVSTTYRTLELEWYDEAIVDLEKLIDKCVKTRNKVQLAQVLENMEQSRPLLANKAGEAQVEELDRLINRVSEMLR